MSTTYSSQPTHSEDRLVDLTARLASKSRTVDLLKLLSKIAELDIAGLKDRADNVDTSMEMLGRPRENAFKERNGRLLEEAVVRVTGR